MNIFLSCTSEKKNHRCKAKEMYSASDFFKKAYKYAKLLIKHNPGGGQIYILSAKHYLLKLNDIIDPYNITLNDFSEKEREQWSNEVYKKMKDSNINFDQKTIFLTGEKYNKYLLKYFKNAYILL